MAIPAYYSLIRRGSSGPDVALVQTWLNGIRDSCTWYAALTVDGTFGANAEKAVREFQLRYGLKEDGKVGANTWNVLYARYTAKHGKTTAVRVIPAIGRKAGEVLDFGGLLGYGPIMPVNQRDPSVFINRGGRLPAPMQSLKN